MAGLRRCSPRKRNWLAYWLPITDKPWAPKAAEADGLIQNRNCTRRLVPVRDIWTKLNHLPLNRLPVPPVWFPFRGVQSGRLVYGRTKYAS